MVDDPSPANHCRVVSALVDKDTKNHSRSRSERDGTECRLECRIRVGAAVKVINDSHAAHIKITAAESSPNSLGGEVTSRKGVLHGH